MIEVEVRGKIEDFEKTLSLFKEIAEFVKEKDRLTLAYFRNEVPLDIREDRDEKVDVRLRITNKEAELVMKYGNWSGSDARKEISIPIKKEDFENMIELLKYLNWKYGVILATKTYVFNYRGVEFALVKRVNVENWDYFEAEKMVKSEEEVETAMKELKEISSDMKMELFSEEEFIEGIYELFKIQNSKQ
jgi:adenylate cyclase class IV